MFKRFMLLSVFIACTALVPLAVFGFYAIQVASDHLMQRTLEELKRSVLIDAHIIKHSFDMAQDDLPVLSRVAAMEELIRARVRRDPVETERWRKALERVFLAFSRNRKVYNQIRYLDEGGQELVRVDSDGVNPPRVVPRDQLQNQRQRPYFSETMTLGPGQVYTSPLDLNRERGQIEVPYRPVIRYATSLFDDAGNRRGIVIINLNAGPLLNALYQEGKAARKVVYAVDQEGFYLLHPDPKKQWGGPRDLNTGERIQRDSPNLADRLLSRQAVAMVMGEQVIIAQSLALGSSSLASFIVIVELIPTRVVLAAVEDFRLYLLILLVGAAVLTMGAAVLVGEKLARPIVALEKAAYRIQQGELDAKVEAGGSHEIAALGDAFNAMAEGLAHARSRIERQLDELQARQRMTESVLRVPDLATRMRIALHEILGLIGPTIKGVIYLVEDGRLALKVEEGFSSTFLALGRDAPLDACPWVGTPTEMCAPWEGTDPITEALRQEGVMAWSSLPLVVEEKLEGCLLLANSRAKLMDEDALRAMRAMVDQVAVALHNARLFTESRERLARLTTLREIDRAIAAQLSLEEVIKVVLERVSPHIRGDAVGMSLIDWEKRRTVLAHLRLPEGADIRGEAFTLSESLLESLGVRLQPIMIYDLLDDPRVMGQREIIRRYGLKSYLGVPLVVQATAIGVLHLCTTTPHRFTTDEVDFFATMAGQAAISIQNARMYEMALRRGEALATLTHSISILAQSGPQPEAIVTMLEGVKRATGAGRSVWLAYDEAARRLHLEQSVGLPPDRLHQAEQAFTMSLADPWAPATAALEGRSFYLKQTVGSPFWPVFEPVARSAYCAPLTYSRRLYGVLVLLSEEEDGFTSEALSLADTFALYAGAALANGTLYRELQQAARELEAKVEDRTRELQVANHRLEEAYKEVESASSHKSAFLAAMSHELRTPLNAIIGFAELLRDRAYGPLSAKQDRYVGHIHSSGKHLLALINDILDLSKVEAGRLELHPETFDLREALTATLTEIRPQADAKRLELDLHVDQGLATITADPVRFRQIVLNLLSNAVKFTPEGGRIKVTAITVRSAECEVRSVEECTSDLGLRTSDHGDFVEIAVTDTGIGIKAEDLPKLFQPFTQLESPSARSHQGTGLGLTLTKQLVELHGGQIVAASEGPNRGSSFTVRLPTPPPGTCSRGNRRTVGRHNDAEPCPHCGR